MNGYLENIKIISYFLWSFTGCDRPMDMWLCAEEIGSFAEQFGYLSHTRLNGMLSKGKFDFSYIQFIRNLAFRIYLFTGCESSDFNWYCAELLLQNNEWRQALLNVANAYHSDPEISSRLHSAHLRELYH